MGEPTIDLIVGLVAIVGGIVLTALVIWRAPDEPTRHEPTEPTWTPGEPPRLPYVPTQRDAWSDDPDRTTRRGASS